MTGPLKTALVGCGRIGAFTRPELSSRLGPNWLPVSHAAALVECPGVELTACCDIIENAAMTCREKYGFKNHYSSYSDLFENEEIDLLCIATRTDSRYDLIRLAEKYNVKGIHCEKPIANSMAELNSILEILRKGKIAFSYGALRRFMPVYLNAYKSVSQEDIGDLKAINIKFGFSGLLWTHPHSLDLINLFTGNSRAKWVQASLDIPASEADTRIDLDPNVISANILFENGVSAHILPEPGLNVELVGQERHLTILGDGEWSFTRNYDLALQSLGPKDWECHRTCDTKSGRIIAFEALRDMVLSNSFDEATIDRVKNQHEILFTIVQSHLAGGKRVSPKDLDLTLSVTGKVGGKFA